MEKRESLVYLLSEWDLLMQNFGVIPLNFLRFYLFCSFANYGSAGNSNKAFTEVLDYAHNAFPLVSLIKGKQFVYIRIFMQ